MLCHMVGETHLLFKERAMGTMEKTDKARVMTPIMSPPVLRLTQQQHLWKHGMLCFEISVVFTIHCLLMLVEM